MGLRDGDADPVKGRGGCGLVEGEAGSSRSCDEGGSGGGVVRRDEASRSGSVGLAKDYGAGSGSGAGDLAGEVGRTSGYDSGGAGTEGRRVVATRSVEVAIALEVEVVGGIDAKGSGGILRKLDRSGDNLCTGKAYGKA